MYDIVTDALAKLDAEGSPAQVAARLDMDCCVGVRRSYSTCPVAEWLLATTGLRVLVGPGFWQEALTPGPRSVRAEPCQTGELPENVAGFVWGFDSEHYPALDDAALV